MERGYIFTCVCLFVCLFVSLTVCPVDHPKSCEWILINFWKGGTWLKEQSLTAWCQSASRSGSTVPGSGSRSRSRIFWSFIFYCDPYRQPRIKQENPRRRQGRLSPSTVGDKCAKDIWGDLLKVLNKFHYTKIRIIIAVKCAFSLSEYTKIDVEPTGRAYTAAPDPLAGLRGPLRDRREMGD